MRVWMIVLLFLYTGVLYAEHTVDTVLYDPNGNMKTDQYRSTVLNYDRANQPISITKYNLSPSSSTTYHFGYGIADNRIFKGTMSQAYYYLAGNVYDINADKWEHYPGGVLRLKNNEIHKIVKDHLSNTRAIIGQSDACGGGLGVITAYDYYPFGKVLRKHENPASRFQSTDHEKDLETGYDDRNARLYDDEAFRFMQVDPLSDMTASTYDYCGNNPIFYTDPTGMYGETNAVDQRKAAIQLGYEVSEIYESGDESMFNFKKGDHYASAKSKDFVNILKGEFKQQNEILEKYGVLFDAPWNDVYHREINYGATGACGEPPISLFDIITLGQGGMSLYKGFKSTIGLTDDGIKIGLGLDIDLAMHRGTGAITYKGAGWQQAGLTKVDWGKASMDNYFFKESFKEAAENAGSIKFNVSNFDPFFPKPGITNFEFNHIINNPSLINKTTFINNGNSVFWNGKAFVK